MILPGTFLTRRIFANNGISTVISIFIEYHLQQDQKKKKKKKKKLILILITKRACFEAELGCTHTYTKFYPSSPNGNCNNPQNSFRLGAQKCARKLKYCSGYLEVHRFSSFQWQKFEPTTYSGGRVRFQSWEVFFFFFCFFVF